jgi:hypothetical protein
MHKRGPSHGERVLGALTRFIDDCIVRELEPNWN